MEEKKHILGTFDDALGSLRENVLVMASLTERNLNHAMAGLLQRDDDLCVLSIADDAEIDELEMQIDKDGIDVLLRFQPVASDLRRVVSAIKINSNLERVADQAVSIGRRARKLNQHPPLPEIELLDPMHRHAVAMLRDSVDAYRREDAVLARKIKPRDKALDDMNTNAGRQLTDRMARDPQQLRGYLNLMFIARCLERVGDHATNIAEDAVYAVAAEDIRHTHTHELASDG
ncbi:MAG TPA: phosphate signaling complex protein PhoU [Chthoniobacterales bacterium]|nr:phosphate signaling complex protein PhoU [Chthoniobacterales bacterium]